ncbi:MAG TPA: glycoside hydrolase family 25 protein [Kofleriaceae bacterium]|nr:glycoside hydrolase family 25 protein [Kofleriaceae bacterium]
MMRANFFALFCLAVCSCTYPAPSGSDLSAGQGLATQGSGSGGPWFAPNACASGTTTPGIDVSYYNGSIDWNRVAADGYQFAIVRVSDGTGFKDPKFASYYAGAKTAGLIRGAYQFFRPAENVTDQANLMIASVGTLEPGDLPPVLDVEVTGGLSASTIAANIRTWVNLVKAATGVDPIIYTGSYFWRDDVGGPTSFVNNPLWIAEYTSSSCPNLPSPWGTWAMWQYSDSGSVSGISGDVDLDRFNGTLSELQAFAGGASSGSGSGSGGGSGGGGGDGSCDSATMGTTIAEGACVQSAADQKWYQCESGAWYQTSSTSGCSATYGWCQSATLGRAVPPRTCVQASSDDTWYQCDGTGWATPVDTSTSTGPAGACVQSYPLN